MRRFPTVYSTLMRENAKAFLDGMGMTDDDIARPRSAIYERANMARLTLESDDAMLAARRARQGVRALPGHRGLPEKYAASVQGAERGGGHPFGLRGDKRRHGRREPNPHDPGMRDDLAEKIDRFRPLVHLD